MTKAQITTDLLNLIGPGSERSGSELLPWINDAYLYLCDQISQVNPDFFTTSATTTLVTSQIEYPLPSDYERIVMVEAKRSGVWKRVLLLPEINKVPITEDTSSQGFTDSLPVAYLYGGKIGLRPETFVTGDLLKIWYVYTPAELTADSDVPAFPTKYHHLIKYGAYANYLDEDDQHAPAEAMRNRFEQRIASMVDSMTINSLDEPKSVTITHNYDLYVDTDRYI